VGGRGTWLLVSRRGVLCQLAQYKRRSAAVTKQQQQQQQQCVSLCRQSISVINLSSPARSVTMLQQRSVAAGWRLLSFVRSFAQQTASSTF